MTLTDVLERLAAKVYAAGGQANWAKAHGLPQSYVSAVLLRKKPPSKAILDALGLERCPQEYRRKRT
jgi:hypothetical protein